MGFLITITTLFRHCYYLFILLSSYPYIHSFYDIVKLLNSDDLNNWLHSLIIVFAYSLCYLYSFYDIANSDGLSEATNIVIYVPAMLVT